MNKLFNLTLGNPNDILNCEHPVVTASQRNDRYVLAHADVPLIARSAFCKNNSKYMTRDEISTHDHIDVNKIELSDTQLVVFIPEPSEYIAIEYIYDIDTYIAVIEIVMKYDMSIAYFYTKCEYALWYIMIKEKSNDLWARNAKLLSVDTTGVFKIKKLRVASSLPGNGGNYPIATTQRRAQPVAKSIVLKPRDRFSSESFERLIDILVNTSAISILDKIVAIVGTSIDHFNIIWSNETIMELLHRYSTILPSVIWYNMRIMHLEYMSSISTSTVTHRHIINGKVAALLPQSDIKNFTNSIYYTEIMKEKRHISCLPSTLGTYRGIYLHNEFIERFNRFSDNSLKWIHGLDGKFELDVDDTTTSYRFYITGSTMAACLIKNPLEHGFDSLNTYFEEYYPSRYSTDPEFAKANNPQRDIDEEIERSDLFDIIDTVEYPQYNDNDNDEFSDDDNDDHIHDIDGKQKSISEIEQLKIDDKYYGTTDIDIAIECDSFDTLTDIVSAMIDRIKQSCKQSITMTKTSNCRYAIDGLHRRIEVFMVKSGPSIIGSFHLPCVRAWYDGSDTFMFVDFITAAYTGINLNLFWTSSGKDARGIILKYYQRGFSMLLNNHDTSALIAYINAQDAWPNHQCGGSYWARMRFKQQQIYMQCASDFFNPSLYQYGIHANLNSNRACIDFKSVTTSKFISNINKKITRCHRVRSNNELVKDTRYIRSHGRIQGVYLPKLHPRLLKYL